MGARPILVNPPICKESVKMLEDLMRRVKDREVQGVMVVYFENIHDYEMDVTGIARRWPSIARGALDSLHDRLGALLGTRPDSA